MKKRLSDVAASFIFRRSRERSIRFQHLTEFVAVDDHAPRAFGGQLPCHHFHAVANCYRLVGQQVGDLRGNQRAFVQPDQRQHIGRLILKAFWRFLYNRVTVNLARPRKDERLRLNLNLPFGCFNHAQPLAANDDRAALRRDRLRGLVLALRRTVVQLHRALLRADAFQTVTQVLHTPVT